MFKLTTLAGLIAVSHVICNVADETEKVQLFKLIFSHLRHDLVCLHDEEVSLLLRIFRSPEIARVRSRS